MQLNQQKHRLNALSITRIICFVPFIKGTTVVEW